MNVSRPILQRIKPAIWPTSIGLSTFVVCAPIFYLLTFIFEDTDTWQHIKSTLLADYILNSILLAAGVAIGTIVLGVSTAWLTSMCSFPGRRFFTWALLLPMAMPAYVIAYTYTGMLEFAGPLQTFIRDVTGWGYGEYYFPQIRSLGGATLMLSLVLYPYVYLLARTAFIEQSVCALEVSRTLGCTPFSSFYRVAIPLARPAIITGLSLALMETLADFGTVEYFGVQVFTTGIFRAWFGMDDSIAAAKLAGMLLLFVFFLIMLERSSRKQSKYHHTSSKYSDLIQYELTGKQAFLAWLVCFCTLCFGFLLPTGQLSIWFLQTLEDIVNAEFIALCVNSFLLALSAAILALLFALIFAFGKRLQATPFVKFSVTISGLGYAVPGTIIAMSILIPLASFDNAIDAFMRAQFDISTGLLFSGTLFALLFAYLVRFLAVSLQTIDAGLGKIKPSTDEAARTLGYSPLQTLFKVHIPIMKGTIFTAVLLVFVDVMKELPATIILRPFNFNTLAVRTYELASDERLADAACSALMIVLTGLIPVLLLSKRIQHSRAGH